MVDHTRALGEEPRLRAEDVAAARDDGDGSCRDEDVPQMRGRPVARRPGKLEVEKHELTHFPYRAWCRAFVSGRGIVQAHRRRDPEEEPRRAQKIALDWAYFRDNDSEDLANVLVVVDRESGAKMGILSLNRHANNGHLISQVAILLKRLGHHGNLEVHTDGEPALVELAENVEAQRDAPTIVVRTSPGDSQANGLVERAVRSVEEASRVLKIDLETRVGASISVHDPIFLGP